MQYGGIDVDGILALADHYGNLLKDDGDYQDARNCIYYAIRTFEFESIEAERARWTIKPIKWEDSSRDGRASLVGLHGLFEIYDCDDRTWRVYFQLGHATTVCDVKVRNMLSREAAVQRASEWWIEWVSQFVMPNVRVEAGTTG